MTLWDRSVTTFQALSPKDQRDLCSLVLALLVVGLYAPVFSFPFVRYDDPGYLYENPNVSSGLNADSIWWSLTTLHGDIAYWHPLTWLSHQLDFQLFHFNTGAHHLTSVMIHAANTVLVLLLAAKLTTSIGTGLAVAFLFGLHPLRVESVTWLAERKDVLCAFFYLASIYAYLRYAERRNFRRYMVVLLLYIMALMSKPMAVTLPCVLLLLDVWPLRRFSFPRVLESDSELQKSGSSRHLPRVLSRSIAWRPELLALVEKTPFFALAILISILAVKAQNDLGAISAPAALPASERLANAVVAYGAYLHKTIFPVNLSVHYNHPLKQPLWLIALSASAIAILTAIAVKFRRQQPLFLIGWLWFLGTLVPTIGLIQVGSQWMADRYTYIPSVGLLLALIGLIGTDLCNRIAKSRVLLGAATAAAVVLFAVARNQIGYWEDNKALFERAAEVDPTDWIARVNAGKENERLGQLDVAMDHYQMAIRANPHAGFAYVILGDSLIRQGKPAAAIPFLLQALGTIDRQSQHEAHNSLAKAYAAVGQSDKAIHQFQQALICKPNFFVAKLRLADVLATASTPEHRNGEQAIRLVRQVLRDKSHAHPEFLDILAAAYAESGQFTNAVETAKQAILMAHQEHDLPLEKRIREKLELYKQNKPFHQTVTNQPKSELTKSDAK